MQLKEELVSDGEGEFCRVCYFLGQKFKIIYLGDIRTYLGIQVSVLLSHERYINKIFVRCHGTCFPCGL